MGFFDLDTFEDSPNCPICKLNKTCRTSFMLPVGEGKKSIVFIFGKPTQNEDMTMQPFTSQIVGLIEEHGKLNFNRDCWGLYACGCGTSKGLTDTQILACRPNIIKNIKELNPTLIIPVGSDATKSIMSYHTSQNAEMDAWIGYAVPSRLFDCWICPIEDPISILKRSNDKGLVTALKTQLEFALHHNSIRPYNGHIPNELEQIKQLHDEEEICNVLNEFIDEDIPVAFDYETDRLKPENNGKIISIGISDGQRTYAFKYSEYIKTTWIRFLKSSVPKIAANLKFEDRWSMCFFNVFVNNWYWDTMLASHILDCSKGSTGLKFQAFVNFGIPDYDTGMDEYFKSKDSNSKNTVENIPDYQLLLYNGMDALMEYKLATKQIRWMKNGSC